MSVTEFVFSFIFMAVAVMTVLVVGTLGAADLLHRPRRSSDVEEHPDRSHTEHQPDDASDSNAEVVAALMPLGSSLSFVSHSHGPAEADPPGDHEDPPHGRAA
jgi:hypothetical protein